MRVEGFWFQVTNFSPPHVALAVETVQMKGLDEFIEGYATDARF